MLQITDLETDYGNIRVLKKISFRVSEGQVVAIIGANGAGKTTTMKTIAGLLQVKGGEILFHGKSIAGLRPHQIVKEGLSLVPEGRQVLASMSVLDNLILGAYQRRDHAGIKRDMERMFRYFPILEKRAHQQAGTLSGGEQQMLAIARALMARPRFLLLDEPSMGLAPLVVADIFARIKEINREGTTILIVEQNVRQVLKIADYGYVMETGRIVHGGKAAELLQDPIVRESYLGIRQKMETK